MQLGDLRAGDIVHFQRPVHAATERTRTQIPNLGITVLKDVSGADVLNLSIDRGRVDLQRVARHVAVEPDRLNYRFLRIAFKSSGTSQLDDADRQRRVFQDLTQFTGIQR